MFAGIFTCSSGTITSFNPKTPFHAVDYNDFKEADDNNVKLTGNQTITGTKTFSSQSNLYRPILTKQDSNLEGGEIFFAAGNNEPNASKNISIDRYNGRLRIMGTSSSDVSGSLLTLDFQNRTATTITPTTADNSTEIATTAFVNNKFKL